MDVVVVGAPVDQPGIPVMGKDDRLVGRELGIEIAVAEAVRMLPVRCMVIRSTTLTTRI
jgi:hypothetical protein